MADNIASLGVGIDFDPAAISALNAMMRDGVRVGIDPREITKIDQILAKQRSAATQIFSQAIKQGSMHLAKDLEKTVREHNQLAVSLATKTAELHRKAEDATLSAIQRKTARIDLESAKRAMKSLDEEFKVRTTREQELLDTQKEHIEEMLKLKAKESGPLGGAATAGRLLKGTGSAVSSLKDALSSGDFSSVFEDLGDSLGKRISVAINNAQGEGAIGGMSGVLSKIGPALAAIGVLAGGIALVVKLLIDANEQTKEFNTTLLAGGASMDVMVDQTKTLDQNFRMISDSATQSVGIFEDFRVLGKEQLEILAAFNESGYTYKEMSSGAKDVGTAYRKAASEALVWSNIFNTSATEMAGSQGLLMEEMNLGLASIGDQFQTIFNAAKDSGFGVKRFYGMVIEATSGMSLYNTQLDTTGGLLSEMSKLMDPKRAAEFVKNLQGGFGDESLTDKAKRVMTSGSGNARKVLQAETMMQKERLNKLLGKEGLGSMLDDAMGKSGIQGGIGGDLSKVTEAQRTALAATLTAQGEEGKKLLQHVDRLINVSKGAKGGVLEQGKALDDIGPGGKLAMQLNTYFGKSFHELSTIELIAAEKQFNISTQQRKELVTLSRAMDGTWNTLKGAEKAIKEHKNLTAEQKKALEDYSLEIKDGNIVRKGTGEAVDKTTFQAIMGDQVAKVMGSSGPSALDFAKETAASTKSLDIIGKASESFLATIAGATEGIYEFLQRKWFGGESLSMKSQREIARMEQAVGPDQVKAIRSRQMDVNSEVDTLKGKAANALARGDQMGASDFLKKAAAKQQIEDDLLLEIRRMTQVQMALDKARNPENVGAINKEDGLGKFVAGEMAKIISEDTESTGKKLETQNTTLDKILKEANEPQAKEIAKNIVKEQENALRRRVTEETGLSGGDQFNAFIKEARHGNYSDAYKSAQASKSARDIQGVRHTRGAYLPDGGNKLILPAADDNALFWRRGEEGFAHAAIGSKGLGGGGNVTNANVSIHITTNNPQQVYGAVRDVLHKVGVRAPKAGGVR